MSYQCLRFYVILSTSTTTFPSYFSVTCTTLSGLFLLKQCLAFIIDINMHWHRKKYIMNVLHKNKSLIRLIAWRVCLLLNYSTLGCDGILGLVCRCPPLFYRDCEQFKLRVTSILSPCRLRTLLFRRDIKLQHLVFNLSILFDG